MWYYARLNNKGMLVEDDVTSETHGEILVDRVFSDVTEAMAYILAQDLRISLR